MLQLPANFPLNVKALHFAGLSMVSKESSPFCCRSWAIRSRIISFDSTTVLVDVDGTVLSPNDPLSRAIFVVTRISLTWGWPLPELVLAAVIDSLEVSSLFFSFVHKEPSSLPSICHSTAAPLPIIRIRFSTLFTSPTLLHVVRITNCSRVPHLHMHMHSLTHLREGVDFAPSQNTCRCFVDF